MNQDKFYRTISVLETIVSGGVVAGNELCQALVRKEVISYQTHYGYLTDIFAIPFVCGVIASIPKNSNSQTSFSRNSPAPFAVAAAIYSLIETSGFSGKFDPYDVLSYWVGAGMAYGIHRVGKSKETKDFMRKLNPFKRKN